MPKEFVLYADNHALQFFTRKEKLNQRCVKWIQYMHNFTFVIKNINGQNIKVEDALIKRCSILQECQVTVLGFDHLKELYKDDPDFKEIYDACENLISRDMSPWIEYLLQEGLLFKVG